MSVRAVASAVLAAGLFTASAPPAGAADPLVVSPASGAAPLTVAITGPGPILERISRCRFGVHGWSGQGGHGLHVDWGDGSQIFAPGLSGSCAEAQRRHVYSVPGTYRVRVKAWHPGPTDAAVTDWAGEASVTVVGMGPDDRLELLEPQGGESFRYQEFPKVRWRAAAAGRAKIRLELLSSDGAVVTRMDDIEWSTVGDGSAVVRDSRGFGAYDAALKAGHERFFVRATLLRDGKPVASKDGPEFSMTARYPDSIRLLQLLRVEGDGPFKAAFSLNLSLRDCSSYRIDWGDGEVAEVILPTATRCPLNSTSRELSHEYAKAGKYRVTIRTNDFALGRPLESVVGYGALEVDVTASGRRKVRLEKMMSGGFHAERCAIPGLALPDDVVVWAVGGRGRLLGRQIDQSGSEASEFDVTVKSGRPVALILSSYDPAVWKVRRERGTKIAAVLVAGFNRQGVAGLPEGTPLLLNVKVSGFPCGYFGVHLHDRAKGDAVAEHVFGRPIDQVFDGDGGRVEAGDPIAEGDDLLPRTVNTSGFFDPNMPPAGEAGLKDLVRKGVLRPATESDVRRATGVAADKPVGTHKAFVVLKPMVYPAGLFGGHSATFLVEEGVPLPTGDPGHSSVWDMVKARCVRGPLCR
ncbi:MAG: PKD domain-containing protein [Elusimicrobia bacterium]|nr:PKD domain-containing protein [Elusimicrobiota bacterium]